MARCLPRRRIYKEARRLRVNGFARNLDDGSAEIVAEGERAALEALLQWMWKGSPGSHVEKVESEWAAYTGEFDQFSAR